MYFSNRNLSESNDLTTFFMVLLSWRCFTFCFFDIQIQGSILVDLIFFAQFLTQNNQGAVQLKLIKGKVSDKQVENFLEVEQKRVAKIGYIIPKYQSQKID